MNKDEVLRLAKLARIEIPESEAEALSNEFGAILEYVGEIKNASADAGVQSKENFPHRNVMREDENPHDSGAYTETLLSAAPRREGQFVKVKKIL